MENKYKIADDIIFATNDDDDDDYMEIHQYNCKNSRMIELNKGELIKIVSALVYEEYSFGEVQYPIIDNLTLITFDGEDFIDIDRWDDDENFRSVTINRKELMDILFIVINKGDDSKKIEESE